MQQEIDGIIFRDYVDESLLDSVMCLVGRDLSEPYSSELMICLNVVHIYQDESKSHHCTGVQ